MYKSNIALKIMLLVWISAMLMNINSSFDCVILFELISRISSSCLRHWNVPDIRESVFIWKSVFLSSAERRESHGADGRRACCRKHQYRGEKHTHTHTQTHKHTHSLSTFCSVFWQMHIVIWQCLHQLRMSNAGREVFPFPPLDDLYPFGGTPQTVDKCYID